jgi:hypothetical protein
MYGASQHTQQKKSAHDFGVHGNLNEDGLGRGQNNFHVCLPGFSRWGEGTMCKFQNGDLQGDDFYLFSLQG